MILEFTKRQFDGKCGELDSAIRRWWRQEQALTKKDENAPDLEGDIWSTLPKIDSKAAVKASIVVEDILGVKIPPSMIKKGGYETIDEMVSDLLFKLRECCSSKRSAAGSQLARGS